MTSFSLSAWIMRPPSMKSPTCVIGVVEGEEGAAEVGRRAVVVEGARHRRQGVTVVVGVAAVAVSRPAAGEELTVADGAGRGGRHVAAEVGLHLGDRR